MKFWDSASFGKRIEYYIVGLMLKDGVDCYMPLVDDDGIDVVVRKSEDEYIEVQIKARSMNVKEGNGALFAALTHEKERKNYYFIFYSERLKKIFIMSSKEFLDESTILKSGNNAGKRSICFNGYKKNKENGEKLEYVKQKFSKYIADDFSRWRSDKTG
ncbi:hypothetical protein LJC31_08570 [Synergistaceae bacterium OttesenSCG-928-I11]|nr:hypothetical protein [Synergistaceae bacterium OttesenSCG-928-I11]